MASVERSSCLIRRQGPLSGSEAQERLSREDHDEILRCFKSVADVADGLDKNRLPGIGFNFASQCVDESINASRRHIGVVSPDAAEDFIARQRSTRLARKKYQ